ncbi:MAG TPA: hypothetical protein VMJ92_03230 [Candidatus Limnocylindrales bacterium]|nr:hypothetical protein [Candidatus Limnocylindrales bacterium]
MISGIRPIQRKCTASGPRGAGPGMARYDFLAEGAEIVRPGQRLVSRTAVSREVWDRDCAPSMPPFALASVGLRAACAEVVGHRKSA